MLKRTYEVTYKDGTKIVMKGKITLFANTTNNFLSSNCNIYLNSDDVRSIEDITGEE